MQHQKIEKPCSLVLIRNNRRLTGTAAQLTHISECGGWDSFLKGVAEQVLDNFAKSYNDAAHRSRLQAVGDTVEKAGGQ